MKLTKTNIALLSLTVGFTGLLLLENLAVAAIANTGITQVGPSTVGGLVDVIRNAARWIYILFFIIAVVFIIFAAFTYLTAAGDEEKVKKAKNMIIYAAIAIVVALLAVAFETIIANFLTTTAPTPGP